MKESIVRLRALEKQRFAYRYALNSVVKGCSLSAR